MRQAMSPKQRLADAFAPNPDDNVWLDCLRTLAIALVLLRHGQRALATGPDATFLETLSLNGWVGVDLFFVLSGYLVSSGLLRSFDATGTVNLGRYATKRIRRIVPAYFCVLALVVIGYFPAFKVSGDDLVWRTLYHAVFMQDVWPRNINVVFWSLGVEAKYYAAVPFLLLPLLRVRSWMVIGLIGLLALAAGPLIRWIIFSSGDYSNYVVFWSALRSPFYACLEPFVLGVVIALIERRGVCLDRKTACRLFVIVLVSLALLLGSDVFMQEITLWDATAQPLILALIFGSLVWAAINMKTVTTRLEPYFRVGARLSYALYLVHFPLIPLCLGLANATGLGVPGFWMLYLCISAIHAAVILAYVEIPFWKRNKGSSLVAQEQKA